MDNINAASAQIGIATAQLYPAITLSAGISASSLNGGNLFNVGGLAWSIAAGLAHDANLLAAEQHALDMASESVRLQRIIYARGGAGILQLLDAQREYQQALLGYVRAHAQRYQDTIQLLVAMGGGWWDAKLTLNDESSPAR